MKIIYILTGLSLGGAEKQVCLLANEMKKLNHEVIIVCLKNNIEIKPKKNIEVISLGMNKNPLSLIRTIYSFRRIIKKFNPDVIHAHMIHAIIFCRIMRLFYKINKIISTSHSSNNGGKIRSILYRFTYRLDDITTHVSSAAAEVFVTKKIIPKNVLKVVYNGLSTESCRSNTITKKDLLGICNHKKVILAVGRLTKAKDYATLIHSIDILSDKNLILLIAGDGELKFQLEQLVQELNLENNILFLGSRNDVPDLMSIADIFVLSSKWEGFPSVIGEAILCNCPIVTTQVGGALEWFSNNEYRFSVATSDPAALAKMIKNVLLLDNEQRLTLTESCREYAQKHFAIKNIVNIWLELYRI